MNSYSVYFAVATTASLIFNNSVAQAQVDNNYINDMDSRILYLEEQLRSLTGKLEELDHQMKSRELNNASKKDSTIDDVLGKLNNNNTTKSLDNQTIEIAKDKLSVFNEQTEFEQAIAYLDEKQYDLAQSAFERFLSHYPNSESQASAKYWLAEIHYIKKNYKDAAVLFMEVYQFHKKAKETDTNRSTTKGAEALIKLALSLKAMKNNADGCEILRQLQIEFPVLPVSLMKLKQQALDELSCPKR